MSKVSRDTADDLVDVWYQNHNDYVSAANLESLKESITDALDSAYQEGYTAAEFNSKYSEGFGKLKKSKD